MLFLVPTGGRQGVCLKRLDAQPQVWKALSERESSCNDFWLELGQKPRILKFRNSRDTPMMAESGLPKLRQINHPG
jgi:hypothetical protein